jgi:hypothetical protein
MTKEMKSISQTPESVFPVDTTEIARKFGVPGQIKDVLREASRVHFVNLPEDTFPKGLPGKLIEAVTRLKVVKQNSKLTTKQSEFVEGLTENIEALYGLMTEFPERMKDTKGQVMKTAATGALIAGFATACTGPINVHPTETIFPTSSPTVEVFTPTFTPEPTATPVPQSELTGPETTSATATYPTTLSVDDIKTAMTQETKADSWDKDNSQYITDLVTKRTALWNSLGLNLTDSTKPDYVLPKFVVQTDTSGNVTNWDYVLYGKDGGVAQWLQIKDSQGSWHWAEKDMWDPALTTVEGESQYSLPNKLDSAVKVTKDASGNSVITLESTDTYGIVFVGKNEVLVEFDKDGNPKRWLDKTTGKMAWLDGVDKVDYITPDGGTISYADAQKVAAVDGEVTGYLDNSQSDNYIEELGNAIGLTFGHNINGILFPPNVTNFTGNQINGNGNTEKFGFYFALSTGKHLFLYIDTNGVYKAIQHTSLY